MSPTALGLASGLREALEGVSATHYCDTVAVTLKWERSESAIDGSRSDLLAVFGELALTSSWDLVLELGGFEGTDGDSVVFGSVSATRSW